MSDNQELFDELGAELWCPSTQKSAATVDVLANKLVLLYFSAHWCAPCRKFTPLLTELYRKLKARDNVEDFEIVFCSMDRSESEYQSYAREMPWWCIPYKALPVTHLAVRYGAEGIPHLVILDKNGKVLVPDGVGEVSVDQDGTNFPWRPKPLADLLPETYIGADKTTRYATAELDDKYIMLYFSAHWCPPCRGFTPKLSKAYTALKQQHTNFELLFVSSDKDESAFKEYFGEMTFCAIPYEERESKAFLSAQLGIRGIPALVMLGPREAGGGDRPVINTSVRAIIDRGDYLTEFPFHPKKYGDLNFAGEVVNQYRCVVVFHEGGDDEEQEAIQTALKGAAEICTDTRVRFLWGTSPTGITKAIRDALKLGPIKEKPVMVLLDDDGTYNIAKEGEVTVDSIGSFLSNPGEKHKVR